MDSHLIAIKVRVESCTNHRVNSNCFSFNEDRLKRLDAKPVKRRGTIQEYWMTVNNIFKDLPDFRAFHVNYLFRALDCLHDSTFDQLPDDERLEQFDGHVFWQSTLV